MAHDHSHHDHQDHDHHDHGGHSHAHGGHGHSHAPKDFGRAFAVGVGLNFAFVLAEVAAGLWSGSLALLADAGHNLSDVLSLLLAWGATVLARRAPSANRTYGLRKATILASLANAVLLLVAVGVIVSEAVRRFAEPADVATAPVMIVAAIGVVINTATALMFMRGHD
ncbi:MAG: cation diffusion facilitator family transporter, partial [Pseudomonadota bacterium]